MASGGIRATIEVKGIAKALARFKEVQSRIRTQVLTQMDDEVNAIMARSMQLTPVKRGWLRASHRRANLQAGRSFIKMGIEVGDDRVDYAIYVHERTDLYHKHGQAKFLEKAVDDRIRGLERRVGQAARP